MISRNISIIVLLAWIFNYLEDLKLFYIFLISTIIFFIFHAFTLKKYIDLENTTNNELTIFENIPNEEKVDEFLENLFLQRNDYLKLHYYYDIDVNNEDNINNLKILLNDNVITQEEYNLKISEKFLN